MSKKSNVVKRVKTTEKNHKANKSVKEKIKSARKKLYSDISNGDKDKSEEDNNLYFCFDNYTGRLH